MPLYEYRCNQCGEEFEVLQRFSDPPLKVHAGCGGVVGRLLSSPTFQFKGTGWYVTDYAPHNGGSGKNGASKQDSSASKPAEAGGSKPAASSEPAPKRS